MELDYEIHAYLVNKKNFKIDFLTDFSGHWYFKKIKTKLFKEVTINIVEFRGKLQITCEREGIDEFSNTTVDFINMEYSRKNLKKITKLLKNS